MPTSTRSASANRSEWKHDPYKGKVADGKVWGRGAGDQEGAIPAMVYAAKILRDLKVDMSEFSLLLTFTVMEEDCDGLCWQYIVNEDKIRPDVVVVTDSTDCKILRGQRGRMEIGVTCLGKSCHGSMPEKGDNAVYKIAKVVREIEALNERLKGDEFLGKGTITVSYIDCKTPSLCAVPGQAYIHLDRRLTVGDTKKSAVAEVKDAVKRAGVEAKVEVLRYARPSYTGLVYETEKYFPMWCEDGRFAAGAGGREDAPRSARQSRRSCIAGHSARTPSRSPACSASPASASARRRKTSPTP